MSVCICFKSINIGYHIAEKLFFNPRKEKDKVNDSTLRKKYSRLETGTECEKSRAFPLHMRPGVLQFTGPQRVGHDCATELN